jgi:hypothetical protein
METTSILIAARFLRPRYPAGLQAEDAHYAANGCDWIDALIHAFTHARAIPARAPVTTAPSRGKLA